MPTTPRSTSRPRSWPLQAMSWWSPPAGHPRRSSRQRLGFDALLVQFAPITAEVFEALPQLRLLSRYGVGVDVVDTEAARDHGVWVCNVPDYGTTEVAMHAVAMLLALLRNVAGHDREVRAGHWDYHLGGQLRRPSSLTLVLLVWDASEAWPRSGQRLGSARSSVMTPT